MELSFPLHSFPIDIFRSLIAPKLELCDFASLRLVDTEHCALVNRVFAAAAMRHWSAKLKTMRGSECWYEWPNMHTARDVVVDEDQSLSPSWRDVKYEVNTCVLKESHFALLRGVVDPVRRYNDMMRTVVRRCGTPAYGRHITEEEFKNDYGGGVFMLKEEHTFNDFEDMWNALVRAPASFVPEFPCSASYDLDSPSPAKKRKI